jgi:hypothetical protein
MKLKLLLILTVIILMINNLFSQTKNEFTQTKGTSNTKYGNTLNLGLAIGYYGYVGLSIAVITANYEFDVAKNFSLAPFVHFYSLRRDYYWGNKNYPYRNYYYQETSIPIGVKGTYYFDQILVAGANWDFYLAGSLGFIVRRTSWENGYYGDKNYYSNNGTGSLYLQLHVGTEYRVNNKIGLILDLSTAVSAVGIAIH